MGNWNILVADDLASEGVDILRTVGTVVEKKGLKPAELKQAVRGCHALVVRSATLVTADILADADRLLVIGRAGIGVDNIDVGAATARGIVVMNTPESGATTTAELAIAHLFALARKIPVADRLMHEGRWEKSGLTGVEVTGKTLGIVGFGRIGRVVADRAIGLKMRVLAYDPFITQDRAPAGVTMVPFDRCLASADFITVHAPLMDATRHLIDAKALALVKQGARLIHCARGGIVDEAALIAALESGRLAGAALDVFEQEPLPKDSALLRAPNLTLTPHLGASTEEARKAVAVDIAHQVAQCLRTGLVLNGVNVPHIPPQDADFIAPFLTLVERLASLLMQTFPGPLTSLKVATQGEIAERSQRPLLTAALCGALRHVHDGPVTAVNAARIADDRKVAMGAEQSTLKRDFVNLARVEVTTGGVRHVASGTLIGRRHLRMVEIDDFLLDAIPEGNLLVTFHHDRPGVIGAVGTVLGAANVNISRLQLGVPHERSGLAVGVFNVDSPPPPAVLEQLRKLPNIDQLVAVAL